MWFPLFFGNIDQLQMNPIVIYDNNHTYISLSKNLTFYAHTKHIEINNHFVQNKIEKNFIKLVYCNV
jgi:hypothetical protein